MANTRQGCQDVTRWKRATVRPPGSEAAARLAPGARARTAVNHHPNLTLLSSSELDPSPGFIDLFRSDALVVSRQDCAAEPESTIIPATSGTCYAGCSGRSNGPYGAPPPRRRS